MDNTKQITLNGLFWNTLDRFGNQVVVTVVGIITARILFPEDFAVLAALSIFTVIATSLVDSGLATSLVRSKTVLPKDYSTMFVFNLWVSLLAYLLLYMAAPLVESYYEINNLSLYARVLFIQLIVHALGIVQNVMLLRAFKFQVTAKINVISVFVSGILAVGIALWGFGVWALLLQPLLNTSIKTFLFWYWGEWSLNLSFSWSSLKSHMAFSITFMLSNLIAKAISPLYYSFIGKQYTDTQTGYYYQANKWGETPSLLISSIIQGTTLSTLAPIQQDYPRFLNACRKTMSTLAFVLFPVGLCAIVIAQPAFVAVLGERYAPSVPYFQLLCFAGIFISLADLNINFLNIKGKSHYALSLELLKLGLVLTILYFTLDKGMLWIVIGQLLVRVIYYILVSLLSKKVYGYGLLHQLADLAPTFVVSVVCAAIAYLPLLWKWPWPNVLLFMVQAVLFMSCYLLINQLFKNNIWMEILSVIKHKLAKRK